MILFLDEDRAYLSWVTHHRSGFVLDCHRKPTKHHLILHRAIRPAIKHSATKTTHWTTGHHMKACSLNADELKTWAHEQTGANASGCVSCLVCSVSLATENSIRIDCGRQAVEFPRTDPGKVAGQLAGKGDQYDRPSAGRWNL